MIQRRHFVTRLIRDAGAVAAGAALLTDARPLLAQQRVYLSEQQALKLVFPHSERVVAEDHELSAEQERSIAVSLRYRLASRTQHIWRGLTSGHTDGYAMILNE